MMAATSAYAIGDPMEWCWFERNMPCHEATYEEWPCEDGTTEYDLTTEGRSYTYCAIIGLSGVGNTGCQANGFSFICSWQHKIRYCDGNTIDIIEHDWLPTQPMTPGGGAACN